MERGTKRTNINFRQTPRAFRAARQTQVFSHIKRNIPYRMFEFTRQKFIAGVTKMNLMLIKQRQKFGKKEERFS